MKKYLVKRTFLHFVVGDVIEDITKVFQPGYVDELVKYGYLEESEVLPKTWKDLERIKGWYSNEYSEIVQFLGTHTHHNNRNIFPTKEEAVASIALAQLCQLRDRYNGDWKPDWTDNTYPKFTLHFVRENISIIHNYISQRTLAFRTEELAKEFKNNFSDLLEKAKPLL